MCVGCGERLPGRYGVDELRQLHMTQLQGDAPGRGCLSSPTPVFGEKPCCARANPSFQLLAHGGRGVGEEGWNALPYWQDWAPLNGGPCANFLRAATETGQDPIRRCGRRRPLTALRPVDFVPPHTRLYGAVESLDAPVAVHETASRMVVATSPHGRRGDSRVLVISLPGRSRSSTVPTWCAPVG